ncbi:MAG: hypothetical protein Q8O20_04440 [Sulfuricurvum sp.]|uniref:hypothetical protein n=1 Tax=Sulfuricurvum sp. TaxID=2025608 RepID=UPI0027371AAC|nr:hypothetical protein [Sulfuricurvum sp.]MDP2850301.1 hypothetical protein [Sulfuricurvum sp.]
MTHKSSDAAANCGEVEKMTPFVIPAHAHAEGAAVIPYDRYAEGVAMRASMKKEGWFLNKGVEYAKVCVKELVLNTKNTLYIFNQRMDEAVADTNDVYDALQDAAYRGVEIRLLLEEPYCAENIQNSKALHFLEFAKAAGGNVDIKTASGSEIEKIKEILGSDYHFMVGDESMVRIELGKIDYRAIVSYNETAYAKQLHSLVETAFSNHTFSN